jgi:hypothetical protein
MRNVCAQLVNYLGRIQGINSERSSTYIAIRLLLTPSQRAKVLYINSFIPALTQYLSPPLFILLPLYEYIFYPVSTAPIIRTTEINLKKGNT